MTPAVFWCEREIRRRFDWAFRAEEGVCQLEQRVRAAREARVEVRPEPRELGQRPAPATGSEKSPRAALPNLGLEQARRDFEPVPGVRRNRPAAGVNGHPLKTEIRRPRQDRLDQLASQATVALLRHDVHALHVTRHPLERAWMRDALRDRQPGHADDKAVTDHHHAPM